VHQISDRLYAIAHRILRDGDLAQDALQNALVTAWRQLPHLRDADPFEAWSQRILEHACYVESRRRGRWRAASESVYVDAALRGLEIGRAQLDAEVATANGAGYRTLLAGILAEKASSLALHERAGFR